MENIIVCYCSTTVYHNRVTPPSVPYLGVYLNQLVSIEVGMPTFLPQAPEHINYSKLQKVIETYHKTLYFLDKF